MEEAETITNNLMRTQLIRKQQFVRRVFTSESNNQVDLFKGTTYGLIGRVHLERFPAVRYKELVGGFGEACQACGDSDRFQRMDMREGQSI